MEAIGVLGDGVLLAPVLEGVQLHVAAVRWRSVQNSHFRDIG